ncbi:hypothetical protein [Enterobacter hormaechei]|uniref:hypothetical protein n=1 Tax=Enterobacter hormaechei TaxID=158836 RepID=UPI00294919E3|nr:hypothetical protein [Enterobacter hormaechei]MDV5717567.1 hypothetical protein [Enterobacter hormaechei]
MKPCGSTAEESLRKGLLRLFLCLSCDGTQRPRQHNELNGQDAQLQTADTRPFKNHGIPADGEGNILIDRYEWFLYQQIPDRLNGQLRCLISLNTGHSTPT